MIELSSAAFVCRAPFGDPFSIHIGGTTNGKNFVTISLIKRLKLSPSTILAGIITNGFYSCDTTTDYINLSCLHGCYL